MHNTLYYGDNLDIMRRHIKEESVDLVYLDPPFNSNQDYNVLFKGKDGTDAAAQIKAFEDTWTWDRETRRQYELLSEQGGHVGELMDAFLEFLGTSDMMAYLTMMAPRLVELKRVMKPTASIYLHCDPTASHYLKLLMDGVFGPENFSNEIIWKRQTAKALMTKRLPTNHDVILFYTKSSEAVWNQDAVFEPYDESNLDAKTAEKYSLHDPDGRLYQLTDLTNPNPDRPNLTYEFLGITKVWRWTEDRMKAAYEAGLVVQPGPGKVPRFKRYLDEQRGKPIDDVWTDIPPLNSQANERLGYPTQKPEALLERIIWASSAEGDVVLDPFCGCGTAIVVAQRLNRKWLGIDITHLAVSLMKHRLSGFQDIDYGVIGEPTTIEEAEVLARDDPYQFQWWALGLVGARPIEEKKGTDKGVDGRRRFFEHAKAGSKAHDVIFSVKAGQSIPAHSVRDLRGTMEREKADFGVLISLARPTKNMAADADAAGFLTVGGFEGARKYPRLQCITVGELLKGMDLELPPFAFTGGDQTLKAAPQRKIESAKKEPKQKSLL